MLGLGLLHGIAGGEFMGAHCFVQPLRIEARTSEAMATDECQILHM